MNSLTEMFDDYSMIIIKMILQPLLCYRLDSF